MGYYVDYTGIDSRYKPFHVYSFLSTMPGRAVAVRGVSRSVEAPVVGRPITPIWKGREQFDNNTLWTLHIADIYFKGQLYGLIKNNTQWFINENASRDEEYLTQLASEFEKKVKGKIVWQQKFGKANHFLDCEKIILGLYHSTYLDISRSKKR
jgi:hypothetical protein